MRKLLALAIILLLIAIQIPIVVAAPPCVAVGILSVVNEGANYRSSPVVTSTNIIRTLHAGEKYFIDNVTGYWAHTCDGGYINTVTSKIEPYLTPTRLVTETPTLIPTPTVTPTPTPPLQLWRVCIHYDDQDGPQQVCSIFKNEVSVTIQRFP